MNMKKEMIPSLIILGIICLNIPIALIMYFYAYENIAAFFTFVIPIESILFGISYIYIEIVDRNRIKKKYNCVNGIVVGFKRLLVNGRWLKSPQVEYLVNRNKYIAINKNLGISGILANFFVPKKMMVYYNPDNPNEAYFCNNIFIIFGIICIIIGIIILVFC